jgi:hypothetical protein
MTQLSGLNSRRRLVGVGCVEFVQPNPGAIPMTPEIPLPYYTYTWVYKLFRGVREDMVLHLPYGARR